MMMMMIMMDQARPSSKNHENTTQLRVHEGAQHLGSMQCLANKQKVRAGTSWPKFADKLAVVPTKCMRMQCFERRDD
jgi:hypothetical protein